MTIYTRTGDDGTTLYNGQRVSKSCPQIETLGSMDELTSFIGLVVLKIKNRDHRRLLTDIQKDIYQIMVVLAANKKNKLNLQTKIDLSEKEIEKMEKKLPKITGFILPGGTELSSWFHILRVVCRRAERNVVAFGQQPACRRGRLTIVKYLNRLSDLFFTLARYYSKDKEKTL